MWRWLLNQSIDGGSVVCVGKFHAVKDGLLTDHDSQKTHGVQIPRPVMGGAVAKMDAILPTGFIKVGCPPVHRIVKHLSALIISDLDKYI